MDHPLEILLVDDSPYGRAMVRREMKQEFDNVGILEVAMPLTTARGTLSCDLLIMDLQLCWTDGVKIQHAVRDKFPDRPVHNP